jgi:class 3 adenylate cyclase/DNA-binding CsgD family transcriptional regulator
VLVRAVSQPLRGRLNGRRVGSACPADAGSGRVRLTAAKLCAVGTSTGVVALLFTDLVGSTDLLDRLGADAAESLRQEHFALLRRAVADNGGQEVKNLGDGLMVSFASPLEAVRCAVAIQQAVSRHNRSTVSAALGVRVGLHAGEPVHHEDDFFGATVVVASRLCARARGGQILASELVHDLVGTRGGFRFRPLGRLALKGLSDPVATMEIDWQEPDAVPVSSKGDRTAAAGATNRRRLAAAAGPSLVGRDREFTELETELSRAEAAGGRCVLVSGEAGVGKTRLARELITRHRQRVLGLSARAYPLGSTDAFGLWAEAIERHLQDLNPGEVAEVCGGYLDDLAVLFHSVAAARGRAPERDPPRLRVLEGLARVVGRLASRQPVVVVLDDVHLADASSWEALQHVVRNLDDRPLLVVATARPVELSEHAVGSEIVRGLEQENLLTRLVLPPLDREGTAALMKELIQEPPAAALVQWVEERAQGNPLFVGGLVRALLEEHADLTAPRLRRLPETLSERVTTRLRLLEEPARQTMELLSVLGRPVDWDGLLEMAGPDPVELEARLHALVRVRLIREEEHGRELLYDVSHPLIQEAVYEAMAAGRRRQLHRLAGRTLMAAGRLAEAASHLARSAGVGDTEALAALIEALRQAEARQAQREGLVILASLVELLPPGDARWLDVADALSRQAAWVYRAGIDPDVAAKAMRAVDASLAGDGDLGRRAEVKFRLANFLAWGTGDLEEAETVCGQAVDFFVAAGDERKALLAGNELSAIHGLRGDLPAWRASAERALIASEGTGDRSSLVQALGNFALAAWHQGDFDAGHPAMVRVCDMVREEAKPHRLSLSLVNMAAVHAAQGATGEALALLDEAKAVNPAFRESQVLQYEILITFLAGDFGRALEAAREIYDPSAPRPGLRSGFALAFAALVATELGAFQEAGNFLARAPVQYQAKDYFLFVDYCSWAEGALAARLGSSAGRARLEHAANRLLDKGSPLFGALALTDLVEVVAGDGDAGAAALARDRLRAAADIVDRPLYSGLAALGAAWAALASCDLRGAVDAGSSAVDLLSTTGCRAYLGRAHHALGRAAGKTDRPRAIESLQQAAAVFDECGAKWRREQSLAELRDLRGRGERAAAVVTGPRSLSKRELEVARLAGKGLTAPEIGAELFISERTVEGHLAKIYAKLGVDSKLELVRRAAEFGL